MSSTPEPPAPGDDPESAPETAPEEAEPGMDAAPDAAAPDDGPPAEPPAPGASGAEPPQGYAPAPGYAPPEGAAPQGYAPPPPGGERQPGPAAYGPPAAYPGGVPASGSPVAGGPPPASPKRPPVWAGLLAGVGLQIAGLIVMVMLLTVSFSISTPGYWGIVILLLPFIVLLIGPALLMISWRWRRFATGVLIISAAVWLIIIGPCLGLAMGA
ncbi:hypothetical protein [Microbacterium jejuense]|uniref:hypothetical protein n=1 Tax=Microbacterium jejuense TaxID=1263637 RepID=UPI0031E7DC02